MRQKYTPDIIAAKFIALAEEEGQCKLCGDYKKGNMLVKEINKIVCVMQNEPEIAPAALQKIFESTSRRARGLGAVSALRMNLLTDEAVQILEETSKSDDILGFGSEMALKIWRGEIPGETL
mgnify:FL=1